MSRLERVTHKLFAENAPIVESGTSQVEIGQFGSALAGTYVATNDVGTLQALPAYTRGWGGAVIPNSNFPTLEDMNAVQRVQSYQTGYLYQEGIPEYDANTTYYEGSVCKIYQDGSTSIATSLINENTGNPLTDTNAWAISPLIAGNVLRYNRITNCLLEVPQNIKLELNDGTLTLKAGSKVIVPNGVGVFKEVVITNDLTKTSGWNDQRMFFLLNGYIQMERIQWCTSGSTAPTGYNYMCWYDTVNNTVKYTNDKGATWVEGCSLPFCIGTTGDGIVTSIDQVFNGMGYIGSTIWVDKGVKGLIPYGRNEDGTLKNNEFTTSKVLTSNMPSDRTNAVFAIINNATSVWSGGFEQVNKLPQNPVANRRYYVEELNGNYWVVDSKWAYDGRLPIIQISTDNDGKITSFQPKLPFHAVDYNELNTKVSKSGDTMTGTLKLTSGATMSNVDNNFDYTTTTAPSKAQYAGVINFKDKNNNTVGNIETEHWTDNRIYTLMGVKRNINGSVVSASARLAIDENGNRYFDFPMCSTKPTTTSTASASKIAVVTQNYLNGTSWYRVWSDGFIEQGGAIKNANTPISITFAKTFTDANSVRVLFDVVNTGNTQAYCLNEIPTVNGFKIFRYGGSMTTPYANWFACGY